MFFEEKEAELQAKTSCDRERLRINDGVPQCLNTTEDGNLSLDGDVSQASRQQEASRCYQPSPRARAKSDLGCVECDSRNVRPITVRVCVEGRVSKCCL